MSDLLVRAAVSDGAGDTEVRELTLPASVSRLRVESSAVCGTDVMLHQRGLRAPAVLGHHTIGRIDHLAPEDADALDLEVGTRVAVEEYVGCGSCAECAAGRYRLCAHVDLWTGGERVGMIPVSRASGLHGGNAEFMELGPRHVLHPLPEHLTVDEAAWTLPLANAVDWTLDAGGVGAGSRVAVIGPGYHGLSCVAAALAGGAETVIALGRRSSAGRLDLARRLGATAELNDETVVDLVREKYGPLDAVIDTIGAPQTMATAVQMLGRFGVLVIAGLSGGEAALDPTSIVRNLLTVRGVRGRSPQAVTRAIELLAAGTTGLERIPTHNVPLEQVGQSLRDMDQGRAPLTPHVVIDPWMRADPTASETTKETR
ncbi:threonine dehydrogenase-like Zn-dependent dehydrogenase [Nocardioides luteus]|uniref:Alcohol dehydrogenase n=1 Tax=Nocardioides luteus TaxID=1844 RepID=A0ABQ5SQS2_9ACTN|nr:zinc-binding dehydrogenase [Nocardioides luteus]MDR7313078.1 threonine dehydrogenase-like Zn-dependent dehydrogenase [Nocardioides luteus]GGR44265.1 putative alcohol dehydrogenase adh [Nocardioides luteus]GLJ66139.1 alcohol dehydrogenase [Nocardioides luteus]